jgi:hypothetical protein
MGDNMAFFDSFTDSLKQKWLQFFQLNRDWIALHMEVESVSTPDGGRRPSSYLILGVVNALEPKLAQLMLPFSKLNPDADTLVEVLELNFDPDIALGNRALPNLRIEKHRELDVSYENFNHETLTNSQISSFGQEGIANKLDMGDTHNQTLRASNPTIDNVTQNRVGNSSSNDKNSNNQPHQAHNTVNEFGELSLDHLKEVDSKTSESGFAGVLSDAWGAESATQKEEAHKEMFLGEELPSGSFDDSEDDSEIARLFPNH